MPSLWFPCRVLLAPLLLLFLLGSVSFSPDRSGAFSLLWGVPTATATVPVYPRWHSSSANGFPRSASAHHYPERWTSSSLLSDRRAMKNFSGEANYAIVSPMDETTWRSSGLTSGQDTYIAATESTVRCTRRSEERESSAEAVGAWAGMRYHIYALSRRCPPTPQTSAFPLTITVDEHAQTVNMTPDEPGVLWWPLSSRATASLSAPQAQMHYNLTSSSSGHYFFEARFCVAEGVCSPICERVDLNTLKSSCFFESTPVIVICVTWTAVALLCGLGLALAYRRKQRIMKQREAGGWRADVGLNTGSVSPAGHPKPKPPKVVSASSVPPPTRARAHDDSENSNALHRGGAEASSVASLSDPEEVHHSLPERSIPKWLQYARPRRNIGLSSTSIEAEDEAGDALESSRSGSFSFTPPPRDLDHHFTQLATPTAGLSRPRSPSLPATTPEVMSLPFFTSSQTIHGLVEQEQRRREALCAEFMYSPDAEHLRLCGREVQARCTLVLAEEEGFDHIELLRQLQLAQRVSRRVAQRKRLEEMQKQARVALVNIEQASFDLYLLQPYRISHSNAVQREEAAGRVELEEAEEIALACLLSAIENSRKDIQRRKEKKQQQEKTEAAARVALQKQQEAEEAARQQQEAEQAARQQQEAEQAARQQQEDEEAAARAALQKQHVAEQAARQQQEAEQAARQQQEVEQAARQQQEAEQAARQQQEAEKAVARATPPPSRTNRGQTGSLPLSMAPPFIGFSLGEHLREHYLVVDGFYEGGPAHAAGIELGDRLLSINGEEVHTIADVGRVLKTTAKVGEPSLFFLSKDNVFQDQYQVGIRVLTADPRWKDGTTPFYFDVHQHRKIQQRE